MFRDLPNRRVFFPEMIEHFQNASLCAMHTLMVYGQTRKQFLRNFTLNIPCPNLMCPSFFNYSFYVYVPVVRKRIYSVMYDM